MMLASCTNGSADPLSQVSPTRLQPPDDSPGVSVVAQGDLLLSDTPLGDELIGQIDQGDEATALCFVPRAVGDFVGSAVKVESPRTAGYVTLSNTGERRIPFDLDVDTLRSLLPTCSE
jgi:hypothetical protein